MVQTVDSSSKLILQLWRQFSKRRKIQFIILLGLMLLSSFAEMLTIGAVLPFLSVLTNPAAVFDMPAVQPVMQLLAISTTQQLLFSVTLLFAVAALVAGATRLTLMWANAKLSFAAGADLSIEVYRRTLYQPYEVHISRNVSEVVHGIAAKTGGVISGIILPSLSFISAILILMSVLLALMAIDPITATAVICGFGFAYFVIAKITRKRILLNGQISVRESNQIVKTLHEGLGGIRDVLLDGTQATFLDIYRKSDLSYRTAQGNNLFITMAPRHITEAVGMLLIIAVAYTLAIRTEGLASAIPILGALALGGQRALPVLQQAYASWITIKANQFLLKTLLELLTQPISSKKNRSITLPISFTEKISLNNISFRYNPDMPWIIKDFDLTIRKGERVGFIGKTGCGKSTLLDIVMGLLKCEHGSLAIDGVNIDQENLRSWQLHLAHVPQSIYLSDTSIQENIAFGIESNKIDLELVRKAATEAHLSELIDSWPNKYQTLVGDRGVRLSGGQRQRIGIARALYKQADVIIFDEATSALDGDTEKLIMQSVESLSANLTVLMIAHRIETLRNCSRIIELGPNGILNVSSYGELMFRREASRQSH